MAKSLYSALFDWIVFRTNHALLNNKDLEDNSKVGKHTHAQHNNMKRVGDCSREFNLYIKSAVITITVS